MPQYVRIEQPFADKPTRAALRQQLKDHVVRGIIKIKDETFTFLSGTTSYTLSQSVYSPTSDNFEIEGTLDGIPHVFVFGTDYTVSGKTITWDTNNNVPDNNTSFYVDYTYIGTKSGITDEDSASLQMIILEAAGNAIDDLYDDQIRVYYSGFVPTATGDDLKNVAALVGASHTPASKAIGTLKLIFTRAVSAGDPVTVTANTRFSTRSSTDEPAVVFETTTGSSFSTGETFGYIGIQALVAGRSGNVGNDTINTMVDAITNVESVTNVAATWGGYDKESDDDFRDRAPLAKESKGKSTPNALDFDIRNIPGVSDVTMKNNWYATAHSAIFVTPSRFPATTTLQNQVSAAINSGVAFGCKATSVFPNVINAWMNVTAERTANSDSGAVFNTMSGDVWEHFENLGLGDRFIQQQFTKDALQHKDAVRIKSFTIAETGNADLWINPDQVLRLGYRVSGTGNRLGVFNEAESITCSGDYTTGWVSPLGLDTYASGLSVYANMIYDITAVWLSGNTLATEGIDYRLYPSGYISGSSFFGRRWNCIEWISGCSTYPLNGTPYSVAYQYNALQIDMTSTGVF